MQDLCWIPRARAYSIGIYVDEQQLEIIIERETKKYLDEGKTELSQQQKPIQQIQALETSDKSVS